MSALRCASTLEKALCAALRALSEAASALLGLREFLARVGFGLVIAVAESGQFRRLGVEPGEHRRRVLDQRLFARQIGVHLRDAPFKLGEMRPGAALFAVERFARQKQTLQFAARRGLRLAQRGTSCAATAC